MSEQNESKELGILGCIRTLSECYRKEPNDSQVRIFLRVLMPFELEIVERATARHIESSTWFPTAHELLGICRQMQAEGQVQYQHDPLMAEYFGLCERFYQTGAYIPQEFERLEKLFRNQGRINMADQLIEKALQFEHINQQMDEITADA